MWAREMIDLAGSGNDGFDPDGEVIGGEVGIGFCGAPDARVGDGDVA